MSTVELEFSGGAGGRLQAGAVAGSALIDLADRIARLVGRVSRGIAETLGAGGQVTSATAAAAIATLAAPPAGVYEVDVQANLSGTIAILDNLNMELRKGAGVVARLVTSGVGNRYLFRITLDGSTALSVNATAGATAGCAYSATITATRIE